MGNKVLEFLNDKYKINVSKYIIYFLLYSFGIFLAIFYIPTPENWEVSSLDAFLILVVPFFTRPFIGFVIAWFLTFVSPSNFYKEEILPKSNKIILAMIVLDSILALFFCNFIPYFMCFTSSYLPFYIIFIIYKLLVRFFKIKNVKKSYMPEIFRKQKQYLKLFFGICYLPQVILLLLFVYINSLSIKEIVLTILFFSYFLSIFISIIFAFVYVTKEFYYDYIRPYHRNILIACVLFDMMFIAVLSLMEAFFTEELWLASTTLYFIIFLIFYRLGRFIRKGYLYLRNNHR